MNNAWIRHALSCLKHPELRIQPSHDPLLVWDPLKAYKKSTVWLKQRRLGLMPLHKLLRLSTLSFQAPVMATFFASLTNVEPPKCLLYWEMSALMSYKQSVDVLLSNPWALKRLHRPVTDAKWLLALHISSCWSQAILLFQRDLMIYCPSVSFSRDRSVKNQTVVIYSSSCCSKSVYDLCYPYYRHIITILSHSLI